MSNFPGINNPALINQNGNYTFPPRDDVLPPQASAAGYNQLTFTNVCDFSASNVDTLKTYVSRFKWYHFNFFGYNTSGNNVTFNSDGSVTVFDSNGNACLATCGSSVAFPNNYVGTAFGGGAYFEAVLKFDPGIVNTGNGWPSWWSLALEHCAGMAGEQWQGQVINYKHFSEVDFFEYLNGKYQTYSSTVHDWYGVFPYSGYNNTNNAVTPIAYTDWTQYNKLGCLWIPATASVQGTLAFYVNGVLILTLRYDQFTNQSPPPSAATPWSFGITDQQHMVPIIGAGSASPMTVRSVNIWQKDTSQNLSQ